jgi:hypothetical protein
MKITIISKLFCAFALCVSLMSFAPSGEKDSQKENSGKAATFRAAVFQINGEKNKVKLAVDKGTDQNLRIFIKDRGGKIFYSELFSKKEDKYRRIFDLADMGDGSYVFELYYNNQKITKEVQLETTTSRVLSVQ